MSNNPDPRPASLSYSLLYGSLCFAAVSVLAYSIWAYRLVPGTAAMYSSVAAVYVGLSGFVLSRLVNAPAARKRFPLLFAVGFAAYALCWCGFYFGLHGRYHADYLGSAAGLAALTALVMRAFGRKDDFIRLFAVLFALHGLGYYLGGTFHALVHGSPGQLLYGACHGLGFGAGLGYLLFHCQRQNPPRNAHSS